MIEIHEYTLETLVHEGTETALYRGERREGGAKVAAKLTHGDYPTWRALSRLRREHAILRELDLPGVPRAYDLISHGRGLAMIMEDLGPTSLADLLSARGRLEPAEAIRIVIPIVRTLGALHALHIVHKDVKPRNVMIDEATLEPRLVDFGIAARLAQETQEALAPETLEGTLAYLAPEQTGRLNRPVDRRSDLYALGATLHEMLVGAPPFAVTDAAEAIHAHLTWLPVPAHELSPGVPRGLSDIVLKLLSKAPEDRYQSARGLLSDLSACQRLLLSGEEEAAFPLGRDDRVGDVVLPEALVGRARELEALTAALERARGGAVALALVTGPSGVGKSSLVRELCAGAASERIGFASGKFDPMTRGTPLAAITQAAQALVRQALAEPRAVMEARKLALRAALGTAGRLLTDLCPELELLVGHQPEPPSLGASEAKNRFALLLRRFLSVFAENGAPLVLFLDDLQWADPASLELLGLLVADADMQSLLLIGAYRDDEVNAAHPLTAVIEGARKARVATVDISVGPLSVEATGAFVAAALQMEASRVLPLAQVLWDKTHGNPFFLGQLLHALAEDGALRFNEEEGGFVWDLEIVRRASVTDNVAALMARKIERLPPGTRRALLLASATGPSWDLRTLSSILQIPAARAAADLWEALREGLVLPLGGDYRLLDEGVEIPEEDAARVSYRFLHDRVQEACYALVPEAERPALHLAIGRQLVARSEGEVPDEQVIDSVRHLNLGARNIHDQDEGLDVARLDLRAGRRAMAATAYEAAAALFAAGREIIGADGSSRDRAAWWALWFEGAESEYLTGAFERAFALMDELLSRAEAGLERARVHDLRLRAFMTQGRFADAILAGLSGLSALSVRFPEDPAELGAAFAQGMGQVAALLGDRRIEDLAAGERIEDPEEQLIQKLLGELTTPAYLVNQSYYGPFLVELVRRSVANGNTMTSPLAYIGYGFLLGGIMGRYAEGVAFGRLALSLGELWKSQAIDANTHVVFAYFAYVREPLRDLLPHFERSIAASIEVGDYIYLWSAAYVTPSCMLFAGLPLEEVAVATERYLALLQRTNNTMAIVSLTLTRQVLRCLQGKTRGPLTLEEEGFDAAAETAKLNEKEHGGALFYLHTEMALLRLFHGDAAGALAEATEAEKHGASVMGTYAAVQNAYLGALARARLARTAEGFELRLEQAKSLAPARAKIAALAESCPSNFRHKLFLLDAEVGALSGEAPWEVQKLYDKAIDLARENDYPQEEALASELAGRFLLGQGCERASRGYLIDAYRAYLHWGAEAKAAALAEEMPFALATAFSRARSTTGTSAGKTTAGTTFLARASTVRDAALLLRAAQTIAGEIELSKVVGRLMRIVLENAGADRGALLIVRDERLSVEATFQASPEAIDVGQSRLLEEEPNIAQQAVLYAWRTREALVLDDAPGDLRFAMDPHLIRGKARSILCLPVSYQGRTTGILYLESGATSGAFTAVRVEILGLLASQAAIAIENALLVEEIRAANTRLEGEVAARTGEIGQANEELLSANEQLARELSDRARAEADREALQEQVLDAQRARIEELSAPLLPISDDVLVMPIIGAVDAERASFVMHAALEGARRHRARAMILDVTGMRHVDAGVVSALLSVANALRLLGTQPLITGIQPKVAQTIVELGVALDGLTTLSTLRAGIAHVLGSRRDGQRPAGGRSW